MRRAAYQNQADAAIARAAALRRLLILLFVAIFAISGGLATTSAAHAAAEGTSVSTAPVSSPIDGKQTQNDHGNPAKPDVGLCSGHCAAHTLCLVVAQARPIVLRIDRTAWPVINDQWGQVPRPSLLERPPRA